MTGKEKVEAALNHKEAAVPIDFGGTPVTGIHVQTLEKIRDYYGFEKNPIKLFDPFQMLGFVEENIKNALGIDTDDVENPYTLFGFKLENWKEWRTPWGQVLLVPGNFKTTVDEQGTVYLYPQGDTSAPPSGRMTDKSWYFDTIVRQEPFDEESLDPEDNLEEFPLLNDDDLAFIKKQVDNLSNSTRFICAAVTGDTGLGDIARVPGPMLKRTKGIRGEEEWYVSILTRQDYLREVFDRETDRALINLEKIYKTVGDSLGALFICGTDFGTQESLFCGPDVFDTVYKPYYRKVNNWIHQNTGWKTFKHSCGAIEPLIPHFIDAGFDILNPVQIGARGMDPKTVKEKHGDKIVFWGGGIDTQKTLPFGKPEEVREEVLRNLEVFAKDGGYVFNAIHNVQAKIPIENFIAMIEAVREFNGE